MQTVAAAEASPTSNSPSAQVRQHWVRVGFFFLLGFFSPRPGALMGGGHIRYSRTVQYGTLRMYAEEPPVRDAPGRYSPLPESFISRI